MNWNVVKADMTHFEPYSVDTKPYCHKCLLREQHAVIPNNLSGIDFSMTRLDGIEFIAGIRLRASEGTTKYMGYHGDREQGMDINVKMLRGFNLAVEAAGIRAIQVVYNRNSASQWFGCPDGVGKTQRLSVLQSVVDIKPGFDVSGAYSFDAIPSTNGILGMENGQPTNRKRVFQS